MYLYTSALDGFRKEVEELQKLRKTDAETIHGYEDEVNRLWKEAKAEAIEAAEAQAALERDNLSALKHLAECVAKFGPI